MENNWIKSEDQDPPQDRKILGYTVDTSRDPEIVSYKDKSWWSYVKRAHVPVPKYWQKLPDVHELILDTNRELKSNIEKEIKDCDLKIIFYKKRIEEDEQAKRILKDKKTWLQTRLSSFSSEV